MYIENFYPETVLNVVFYSMSVCGWKLDFLLVYKWNNFLRTIKVIMLVNKLIA
jgi:hypothetical protein